MAIAIHHGANGSYKSAGTVQDYLIPAMLSGRLVVTNLRGVSRDNCFDIFPETHPDFDVIHIDTDRKAGRDKALNFWHWVPLGALILFDEAGTLFPKRLRDSDLKKLDLDDYEQLNRPKGFVEAFEEHRHYNWDIVLMAPNIKSIRDDIRQTSESGYKHKNRALLGAFFKGTYLLGIHDAQVNATSPSHFQTINKHKIKDQRVFQLYQSTKTGKHQDTINSNSIFKSPKLITAMVVAILAFGYAGYGFIFGQAFDYEAASPAQLGLQNAETGSTIPAVFSDSQTGDLSNDTVSDQQGDSRYPLEPFKDVTFKISAYLGNDDKYLYFFNAYKDGDTFTISSDHLIEAGYMVVPVTDCAATIVYKTKRTPVICESITQAAPRGA